MAGDADPRWQLANACGPRWISAEVCAFRVWAPHGEDVAVELQDSEGGDAKEVRLTREGDFWSGEAPCKPGDRYRIAMGSNWNDCFHQEGARLLRRDPCARECDFNSAWCILHPPVTPPPSFAAPTFNELILYELHIGSFVSEADEKRAFAATAEKLEHVASLGFNCIQFMPTAEFGGIWGYNSRQLLAAHGPWGSAADMHAMVQRAHGLGMAVLFDVVLNHGSSKMNVLWNWDGYGPDNCGGIYFEGEKDTPWGKRFAFHKAEVQDYLKQSCRTWFEEYGVDGLRFDSVHNMPWWLLQQLTFEIKAHYPDKILIAEITPENPKVLHDAGFHSCWLHATHFDSVKIMKGSDGGDDPNKRLSMLKNMVAPHGFGNIGGVHSLLGSHDQIGDRHNGKQDGHGTHRYYVSRLGGKGNWHARAQCRAWFGFQNCCKGLPMTFMGTENLQEDWWHVDKHHRLNWGLLEGGDPHTAEMRAFVTASNKLRLSCEPLTRDEVKFVHEDGGSTVLAFMRWTQETAALCIVHLAESQWESDGYGVSTGWGGGRTWKLALNSQAKEFGGWDGSATPEAKADDSGKIMVNIPKWSMLVYVSAQ
ncbi:treZ [Symbiodinium natans]|uniref:1,4-alpha-glucan branching enzyme n=1 Tax=Symbiodinium natans TaxID=878477 RepID=A0A812SGH2_9DINO|nr:treZ [Symbiodinium natans]